MKQTLEELKKIMDGIVGSFIVDENGEFIYHDLPPSLVEKAEKVSKLIYYVTSVMNSTRPFERIIIDSGDFKIISMLVKGKILVVLADKNINLPLLKLVSNVTKSKLKKDKAMATAQDKAPITDITELCNYYDELYGIAAEKLFEIFGTEVTDMFNRKLEAVKEDHPVLLRDLSFDTDGKPKISKLKMNAAEVSNEELVSGLEGILVSMLDTIKDTAGAVFADKAIDEIIQAKEKKKK